MEKYTNYEMCKKCGGVCCKQNGCIYLPEDFENLEFEYIKDLLDKGNISISGSPAYGFYGDGWSFVLHLRARNVDSDIVDLFTKGGPCKLLTDEGCKLDEEERPSLGLLLEPTRIGGPCKKVFTVEKTLDWLNYNDVLERLVKYYTNKEVIEVVVEQIKERIKEIKEKIDNNIELSSTENLNLYWYYSILCDKPYYTPDEVQMLRNRIL